MISSVIWRSERLRTRLLVGFGALLLLAALDLAAFYWGARERARVFHELGAAIQRHAGLTEAGRALERQDRQVRVTSDLLGVERAALDPTERRRTLETLRGIRAQIAAATAGGAPPSAALLGRVRRQVDSLTHSWARFHADSSQDAAGRIAELALVAEPLAARLLARDLPAAIAVQREQLEVARAAFVRTDRLTSTVMWAVLLLSGLFSLGFAYFLSRDLLRAIGALQTGVERVGTGDLSHRVVIGGCDELAAVGESFNAMATRLQQARNELELRNQELANLAFRDPLTRLANRALLQDRVAHALSGRGRQADQVAILFVDLDDFKSINDTLGHAAGDRLLVEVADRLRDATRGSDTVARLGGDEFAILLERVHAPGEAVIVAQRVLHAMEAPFALGPRAVRVRMSIGVADGARCRDASELLRNADVAMYSAKAAGKDRYAVFAPEMHTALLDRVELEADLRSALDGGGALSLAYQPIVRLADGGIVGFEALVRWRDARRGLVSPAQFIGVAEEAGLIVPLGTWVLGEACREAAGWQRARGTAVGISVNVSGRQLEDAGIVDVVREALATSGLHPACLTLEITETTIMGDGAAALERLRALKALGVTVAIDDFGTGYSSLAYLQRFPVDVLKIDKAFVDQVAGGGNDAALARTIVALGEIMALRTVAEGIESEEQRAELHAMGCEFGQGYLFSPPTDAAGAADLLARRAPSAVPQDAVA